MLQTIQTKTEATQPKASTKEKEAPSEDLAGGLTTFFAQFMAAMPNPSGMTQQLKGADATPRAVAHPLAAQGRDNQARAADRAQAKRAEDHRPTEPADLQGAPTDGAQSAPAKEQARPVAQETATAAAAKTGAEAKTATGTQANPAVTEGSTPTAPPSPTEGKPAGTGTAGAPQDAAATAAQAASPEGMAAAKAKAALEQALPGLKVEFQFGDPSARPTAKPALSEFMQQLKGELQTPSFLGGGSGATETPAALAAPDLTALQVPVAATQAALLGAAQPLQETTLASTQAAGALGPAETVGAGAVPGASGAVRVAAPTAPEAAPGLKRETPMAQVDSSIRWLIKNKDQSAELQLHPESLGRVQIKLTVEGTQVHAKLWASEAAAMPVLQEQRASLEASLKAQGLNLGSFDLQHGHQSHQAPLPTPDSAVPTFTTSLTRPDAGQETPALLPQNALGSHRIEIVA